MNTMISRDDFIATLRESLQPWAIALTDSQLERMWHHFELLIHANQALNLTRITDPIQAAVKHYADSLALIPWFRQHSPGNRTSQLTLLDIGTGGGFPAIPLAIAQPDWQMTAIDGTTKKINCVKNFIQQLGLSNCTAFQQRAEFWKKDTPSFGIILLRAVHSLADNLALAFPLAGPHTTIVCYKSMPLPSDETQTTTASLEKLNAQQLPSWHYQLMLQNKPLQRQLCCFRLR